MSRKIKKKHISVLNLSSLYPKTKSRTVLRYFSLYFISLSFFFLILFLQKINGSQVPEVPQSADPRFINTRDKHVLFKDFYFIKT